MIRRNPTLSVNNVKICYYKNSSKMSETGNRIMSVHGMLLENIESIEHWINALTYLIKQDKSYAC